MNWKLSNLDFLKPFSLLLTWQQRENSADIFRAGIAWHFTEKAAITFSILIRATGKKKNKLQLSEKYHKKKQDVLEIVNRNHPFCFRLKMFIVTHWTKALNSKPNQVSTKPNQAMATKLCQTKLCQTKLVPNQTMPKQTCAKPNLCQTKLCQTKLVPNQIYAKPNLCQIKRVIN